VLEERHSSPDDLTDMLRMQYHTHTILLSLTLPLAVKRVLPSDFIRPAAKQAVTTW
jgi:hypothetical protein